MNPLLRRPIRRACSTCVLLLAFAASVPAAAQSAEPAANATALKSEGDAAFDSRRYAEALSAYERAFAIAQDPALLYNIGRSHEAMAHYPQALEALSAFAAKAPPEMRARVPRLAELLSELEAKVSTITLLCNVPGARVTIGDRVVGETAASSTFRVDAGRATVRVEKAGFHPWTRQLDLAGGKTTVLEMSLLETNRAGVLIVRSSVTGASVGVDGKLEGSAPIEVVLPAGTHKLELTREDYEPARTSVVVAPGERKEISLDLAKQPGLLSRWWFWTGVGVIIVGGVVVTYALVTEKSAPNGTLGTASAPLIRF